nr:hypothetical protein Iba_chr01bCG6550 [Ipomoea batatas]
MILSPKWLEFKDTFIDVMLNGANCLSDGSSSFLGVVLKHAPLVIWMKREQGFQAAWLPHYWWLREIGLRLREWWRMWEECQDKVNQGKFCKSVSFHSFLLRDGFHVVAKDPSIELLCLWRGPGPIAAIFSDESGVVASP